MHILILLLFGLIVGAVAKLLMRGPNPGGILATIVIGIVGAGLGGWLGRVIGIYHEGDSVGFVMAIVGAMILLAIYHALTRNRVL